MSGLGSSSDTEIAVVLTAMFAVLVFVYLLNQWRLRKRDAHLSLESTQSVPERAYNQIRIARAGAELLARDGYDVGPVRATLAEADGAQSRGNHPQALRLAESARGRLVALREGRGGGSAPAEAPSEPPSPDAPAAPLPSSGPHPSAGAPGPGAAPLRPKLPAHQVEARFEISVLNGELAAHRSPPGDGAAEREASELARQSEEAYEHEQYSEAWRLALRGRRRLGASIEHVGSGGGLPRPSGPVEAVGLAAPPKAAVSPEEGPRCPKCGRSSRASDRFCRACGTTFAAAACPRCGAPKESGDRFCGVCGTPSSG